MSIYKQAGSPYWYCEFEIGGERVRQSTGKTGKAEAKAVEADLRKQHKARRANGYSRMTLGEALIRYGATVIKQGQTNGRNYIYTSNRLALAFGADTPLDQLGGKAGTRRIADWRDKMLAAGKRVPVAEGKRGALAASRSQGLKAGSINSYLKILRTVLRKAHGDWHTLEQLPAITLVKNKRAGKVRWLSEAEEALLMTASPLYLRQFLQFLLGTGARKTEAYTLVWDNVSGLISNAPNAEVIFEHAPEKGRKTKSGISRTVPLPQSVREMLVRVRDAQRANGYTGERVFLGRDQGGRMVEIDSMTSAFETARDAAGLSDGQVTLHTMRHTYASRLRMRGVDLLDLRDLLGHTDIATTQIYAHIGPSKLSNAVALLDQPLAA